MGKKHPEADTRETIKIYINKGLCQKSWLFPSLCHEAGWVHLMFNTVGLIGLGPGIERRLGFFWFLALTLVLASLASTKLWFQWWMWRQMATGFSGVCYALAQSFCWLV